MKRLMLTVTVLCFLFTGFIFARPQYVSRIPNGSVFSCDTCHTTSMFRMDFKNNGHRWSPQLAQMDSDHDGYTNGQELQDPNGNWTEGQPDPGDPNLVSNPDDPNSTPPVPTNTPTPTPPAPTATPTPPAHTATPTPTPPGPTATPTPTSTYVPPTSTPSFETPTPNPSNQTGVYLQMPSTHYEPGDLFYLDAEIVNDEGRTLYSIPLFVILELYGEFYFYPSWVHFAPPNFNYDYYLFSSIEPGSFVQEIIPDFYFPEINMELKNVKFYGAILNSEFNQILGHLDIITWEFEGEGDDDD